MDLQFTYNSYKTLVEAVRNNGYIISTYNTWQSVEHPAIFRHDIDNDIKKALELANFEQTIGVKSTYFVLLTSDFYNVASRKSREELKQIISLGCDIGLHFDEVCYPKLMEEASKGNCDLVIKTVCKEAEILSELLDYKVQSVSYHRPSQAVLAAELDFPGLINSYGHTFFHEFKYISDSRRRWREPVLDIIKSKQFPRLHILTHAFWYNEKEKDIKKSVSDFIKNGNINRWNTFRQNITDLESIVSREDI